MLPHEVYAGKRIRVTLLKAVWGWAGTEQTIVHPIGTVFEGVAGPIDDETFFEVVQSDGQVARFSTYDSGISVQAAPA